MSITWDEQCARDQAWNRAREFYMANGNHKTSDPRAWRCIMSNDYVSMTASCWEAVKTSYPKE